MHEGFKSSSLYVEAGAGDKHSGPCLESKKLKVRKPIWVRHVFIWGRDMNDSGKVKIENIRYHDFRLTIHFFLMFLPEKKYVLSFDEQKDKYISQKRCQICIVNFQVILLIPSVMLEHILSIVLPKWSFPGTKIDNFRLHFYERS